MLKRLFLLASCLTMPFIMVDTLAAEQLEKPKKDNLATEQESKSQTDEAPVLKVYASRHSKDNALINSFVTTEQVISIPTSVTELIIGQPGIAANGQPGIFQTVNIRGLARQRVQAYINGMRITSERRAGVAASFVDTFLLQGAEVTQGPASTYYGSGAIGGSVHLTTLNNDDFWFKSGYQTDGNEWANALGTAGETYQFNVAYRTRNNGETVNGDVKNNHFSQRSLVFSKDFSINDLDLQWQVIESEGDDIGRDNRRFPDSRITEHPQEKHLLSQLSLSDSQDWLGKIYFHDQRLVTQDLRPELRINRVTTESLDIGASFEVTWNSENWQGIYGIDYFGRQDVSSNEIEISLTGLPQTTSVALDNGEENETAIFATINREFKDWSLHSGLRANHQSQKSAISQSVSDSFSTYFVKVTKPIDNWLIDLSYGTGFRFATLSERLFNGTTARGVTIGNPNLKPEESQALDLGLSYKDDIYELEFHWFDTEVTNFIERIRIDEDTRTFQNVVNGNLNGWQYRFEVNLNDHWWFSIDGQAIRGVDEQGNWLADIPAQQHTVKLGYSQDLWQTQVQYGYRNSKDKFADGEIALESAKLVDIKFDYQVSARWQIGFAIENLFDEGYFNSADDLGTLATGTNIGFYISYH